MPSSWQRWIRRLTRASVTEEKATIRLLTPVRPRGLVEVLDGAQHGHVATADLGGRAGVVVEEADRDEPILGMVLEPSRHLRSDHPGAHDQDRLADQPARARPVLGERQAHAPKTDRDQREQPGPHAVGLVRRLPVGEQADHRDRHRRNRHRADDGNHAVEQQGAQAGAVEPAQVEQEQHERRQRQQRRLISGDAQGGVDAAEGGHDADIQQHEVDGRAQHPPARALQQALQRPAERPRVHRQRAWRVARELASQRQRGARLSRYAGVTGFVGWRRHQCSIGSTTASDEPVAARRARAEERSADRGAPAARTDARLAPRRADEASRAWRALD